MALDPSNSSNFETAGVEGVNVIISTTTTLGLVDSREQQMH